MNRMEMMFQSPSSAPIPREASASAPERAHMSHADLVKLNESKLFSYITEDLLSCEVEKYGTNDAEAKVIFLGGGLTHNIGKATTYEGVPIYAETPAYAKWSEMYEFMGAANRYTDSKGTLGEFVSEAADVVYNLAVLSKIDNYEHAPVYTELIGMVASTLGWTPREALLVAAAKYHQRFVHAGEKDSVGEDKLMETLLSSNLFLDNEKPIIASPTKDQVSNAFDLGTSLLNAYLIPRYHQIRLQKERQQLAAAS